MMGLPIAGRRSSRLPTSLTNMASQTYSKAGFVALVNERKQTAVKIGSVIIGQKYVSMGLTILIAPTEAELDALIASQNLTTLP